MCLLQKEHILGYIKGKQFNIDPSCAWESLGIFVGEGRPKQLQPISSVSLGFAQALVFLKKLPRWKFNGQPGWRTTEISFSKLSLAFLILSYPVVDFWDSPMGRLGKILYSQQSRAWIIKDALKEYHCFHNLMRSSLLYPTDTTVLTAFSMDPLLYPFPTNHRA